MARGDQLGRQWKIIQNLITSRLGKSVGDLAKNLACHPRTVYRDLEALQLAGFPIYSSRIDGKNLWTLLDKAKHQIPIPFSLTELMALYFSRDMLKILKNTVFYESLESLFQKIKSMLPLEYIRYLEQIENSIQAGAKPYKPYGKFRGIIDRVNAATMNKRYIEMVYYTLSRKTETRRKVAPYRIWFLEGTFYLIGYCQLRNAIRIFALDRIKMIRETGETFEMPEDFSIEGLMSDSFGVFLGAPVNVRIWFSTDIAGYISEKIWHETQKIEHRDNGDIIFEATVAGTDEIKFWVMKWGAKALVLEPESLRDEIQAEVETMLETYSRGRIRSI
jgi:predicted DNA-binding transcriptional regulator YafY